MPGGCKKDKLTLDFLRTLVFFGALGCVGWLFVLAARA